MFGQAAPPFDTAPYDIAGEPSAETRPAHVWRRFVHHRLALLGAAFLLLLALTTLAAPVLAPHPYDRIDITAAYAAPSPRHPLGTDELGRDIFSRLLYAGRVSLVVALVSTVLTAAIGTTVGAIAAQRRGLLETALMRATDVMLALPTLPLLLVLSRMLRDHAWLRSALGEYATIGVIVLVLTAFGWMQVARLVYGTVLSLREAEFVLAAGALGASRTRILLVHLIPGALPPVIVASTLGFGARIVMEATISWLGLGVTPPVPSWGNMLSQAYAYTARNPWLAVYPGAVICATVMSINFLGDALRDALDPRTQIRGPR